MITSADSFISKSGVEIHLLIWIILAYITLNLSFSVITTNCLDLV
jgi:hypothetical protein